VALDFLWEVFREFASGEAVVEPQRRTTYAGLLDLVARARDRLTTEGVGPGAIVSLEADYTATSIASLLALIDHQAIVVPIAPTTAFRRSELQEIAQSEWRMIMDEHAALRLERTGARGDAPLYAQLRERKHAGLVLFSSGYTGPPKAAVHDWSRLLGKYQRRRHRLRTLLFLLFDHIGGVDTLFQAISNASAVVVPPTRTPEDVAKTIELEHVQVLPSAPSFLTILLLSEAHRRHDLSSLRYITYGAEVMPQATLDRLAHEFPGVTLLQKYGLTELGTLRSHSQANDSLWVRVGGEGYETRVVDGLLEIRATSSMLGYLNAPSPVTEDGWFMTGDAVEVEGDYVRILGRASDLINVGGRKVYPGEIEACIMQAPNVAEVAVLGERNPFTGQVVIARVAVVEPEEPMALERRIRAHCRERLDAYKVPVRVEQVSSDELHDARHKMARR
jgi:long-chain acyl-CoA synthetase